MAGTWGKCDFKQLKELQKRIEKLQKADLDEFCKTVSKELAARLLAKVIKRTPVGQYPEESGKVGGTLRRGWTGETQQNAKSYAESLPVIQKGNSYEITIKNPVEYASYVEFGHRTRNHKGWVEGRFMLTKSEMEVEGQAQKIIEKKLLDYFGEVFNDK